MEKKTMKIFFKKIKKINVPFPPITKKYNFEYVFKAE